MARVADHLSVDDLEARLRSAQDPTATRHVQVIWLLARGHTIADVAAVTSFVPRWIEQLYEGPGVAEANHGACGRSSECFSSGAAVPVLRGRDHGTALSDDLASGQRPRPRRGRGHGVVCPALGGTTARPLQRPGSAGSGRSATPERNEPLRSEARPAGEAQGSSA